jgi:hypothetical protein
MNKRTIEDRTRTLNLYCSLMSELKRRYLALCDMTGLAVDKKFSADIAAEFCWLQLRMICELIALGCLVAHDDIEMTRTGKLKQLWSADDIIKELDKLHADFYPRPARAIVDTDRKPIDIRTFDGPAAIDYLLEDHLTKADLCELTARCGDELHRGSLKNLMSGKPRVIDYSDFQKWGTKIRKLLSIHEIVLVDSGYRLWIDMDGGPNRKVHGWIVNPQSPRV